MKNLLFITVAIFLLASFTVFNLNQTEKENTVLNLGYANASAARGEKTIGTVWRINTLINILMYRTLFIPDSTLTYLTNDLAENHAILENGHLYRITLKRNQQWSDGEEITVEDIEFSLKAVLKDARASIIFIGAFNNIVGAKEFVAGNTENIEGLIIENNTIFIKLENSQRNFLQILAQFVILPKHKFEHEKLENVQTSDFWTNPIVNGMYKWDGLIDDSYFRLSRNENYTGTKPIIDEIRNHLSDTDYILDYYSTNNFQEILKYNSITGMERHPTTMLFYRYFIYNIADTDNYDNKAIQDLNVRKAIAYAIDKQTIFSDIYYNTGMVLNSGILPTNSLNNHFDYEYNPKEALRLLLEANYNFERPIRIAYYYNDDMTKKFLEKITKYLKDVGLKTELIKTNSGVETQDVFYNIRNYDLALKGLSSFDGTDWYEEYLSTSPVSNAFEKTTVYNSLIAIIKQEMDGEKYNNAIKELQKLEQERLEKLPLFTLNQNVYVNKNRLSIPLATTFGSNQYRFNVEFEKWEIKE